MSRAEAVSKTTAVRLTCKACALPPVRDALVLGKRAPVGSQGVVHAMQAMSPGVFRLIEVEHEVIEAALVRESVLRKIPQDVLLPLILEHAGPIMDATDALSVEIDVEVEISTVIEGS